MSQAAAIDQFLKNRKSPMAGYGKVFVAAGKKYGVDPRLVVAISGIESSFGKHTLGAHNAWGWGPGKKFGSWEDGISSVTKGLRTGYLDRGLRTPEKIVHRYAPGSDGNDTGNWVRVVNQFLGEMGGKVKPVKASAGVSVPGAPPRSTPAAAIELPEFDPSPYLRQTAMGNLADISLTGKTDPMAMLQRTSQGLADLTAARVQYEDIVKSMRVTSPEVYKDPDTKRQAITKPSYEGKVLQPGEWKGTHVTDNLDWNQGRKTAVDIVAAAGTPVGAPRDGVIESHGSAQGGSSIYFRASDGTRYWLGHIDQALPVGTRVKRGQPIAVISADHETPHLHIDRKW